MKNELFKNRYKKDSLRLKGWDYSSSGYYYVTICVKDKRCLLGKVFLNEVILSKIGDIVKNVWINIPTHFNNTKTDEFIIMPNHFHGILIVETCHGMSLRRNSPLDRRFSKSLPNSLSIIINQFKGTVKRYCNNNNYKYFSWQPNYYEHIIRSEESLQEIREYIKKNPYNWSKDEYFIE